MKTKILILIISLLSFSSCENDEIILDKNNTKTQNRLLETNNLVSLIYVAEKNKSLNLIKQFTQNNSSIDPLLKYDVKSYRITYNTVDNFNNPIQASGTILVPQRNSITDSFSVLSYQHGTMFADSEVYNSSFNNEVFLFASTGFITLVPDYVGYNTSSQIQHPYFINKLSDRTLRDMITASTEALNTLNVSHDSKLFLNGFSEGANITVSFLKNLEQNPIPGLTITATSAASGAYALKRQYDYMMALSISYPIASTESVAANSILIYMIYGYFKNHADPTGLTAYLNFPYNNLAQTIYTGNHLMVDVGNTTLGFKYLYPNISIFNPYFVYSVNAGYPSGFRKYLVDNSLINNFTLNSKLMLYHGTSDNLVPHSHTSELYNTLKANNFNNVFNEYVYGGHDSNESFKKGILWLNSLR